ncbi:hypothetical protein [Moritella sp.]|uniref:hypothetical protein n=1 Tax=Moritella sp. TaxID=78556 RepID=UPI001D3EB206|nr:hypothetical protein [Moritella sp.]MCJ8348040.1 hypothetical protein [Moritella sp.]NQZ42631.1 hypothetical protein [Moritella sp.]
MITSLVPVSKQCGLNHLKKLRVELQAIVDSKKVERGVGKCDLNSRVSFLEPKAKQPLILGAL